MKLQSRARGLFLSLSLARRRSLRFESSAKVIGWKGRKRSKARILVAARFVGIIVLIKLDYLPPRAQRASKGNQKASFVGRNIPVPWPLSTKRWTPTRTTPRMSFSRNNATIKMILKLFYVSTNRYGINFPDILWYPNMQRERAKRLW